MYVHAGPTCYIGTLSLDEQKAVHTDSGLRALEVRTQERFVYCVIIWAFLSSADFYFQNQLFEKISFRNTIRVSNTLDPDQA